MPSPKTQPSSIRSGLKDRILRGARIFWRNSRFGIFIFVGLGVLILALRFFWPSDEIEIIPSDTKTVNWRDLRELDLRTGVSSDALRALDGKKIRIPGFLVPLEDNQSRISEFLLVPSPQACIHVPPPPANQMIFVKMNEPIEFQWGYRAFWIIGVFKLAETKSPYGPVSFEIQGESVEAFHGGN